MGMGDDIRINGKWFHPREDAESMRQARAYAKKWRREGYNARIKKFTVRANLYRTKHTHYIVYVSEMKSKR